MGRGPQRGFVDVLGPVGSQGSGEGGQRKCSENPRHSAPRILGLSEHGPFTCRWPGAGSDTRLAVWTRLGAQGGTFPRGRDSKEPGGRRGARRAFLPRLVCPRVPVLAPSLWWGHDDVPRPLLSPLPRAGALFLHDLRSPGPQTGPAWGRGPWRGGRVRARSLGWAPSQCDGRLCEEGGRDTHTRGDTARTRRSCRGPRTKACDAPPRPQEGPALLPPALAPGCEAIIQSSTPQCVVPRYGTTWARPAPGREPATVALHHAAGEAADTRRGGSSLPSGGEPAGPRGRFVHFDGERPCPSSSRCQPRPARAECVRPEPHGDGTV